MVQLWHCSAGNLNSVLNVPHTMSACEIAFRFWGSVIAAAVVCFRYSLFTIFYHILFDFLDNFSLVFSVFLIFIQLYVQVFYYYVRLFIIFLQALVHSRAYESCCIGSSI